MVPVADAKVSLLETVLSERGGLVAVTKEAGVGVITPQQKIAAGFPT